MKPCDKHWAALRAAIEARGLTHLIKTAEQNHAIAARQLAEVTEPDGVTVSGEKLTAVEQVAREGASKPRPDDFDPLMSVYWMVTNRALKLGGLYLLGTPEGGGDYCPICEVMRHAAGVPFSDRPDLPAPTAEEIERMWIDGPADAAHAHAVQLGLVRAQ